MRTQAKVQDTLDIEEVERHPMWTSPIGTSDVYNLPMHIYALRKEVAKRLKPFDGRPNSEFVIRFCAQVHAASALETGHKDPRWLIGQILVDSLYLRRRLSGVISDCQPATRQSYVVEREAIATLHTAFATAVAETCI